MKTLWLRVRAPFAAFRWMQAGVWRATAPIIPPSAAWGLLLNLAHVDTRGADVGGTTQVKADVPPLRLAIGELQPACHASLYQQLHTYPVGASGKEHKERAHGAKYWIAPARREFLVDLDCVIGAQAADEALLERMILGLRGELPEPRYGLPSAGDNSLLIDRVDVLPEPMAAHWYAPLAPGDTPRRGSCRLTVAIDRADSSRTHSELFAPMPEAALHPPESAWTWTPRQP